MLAVSLLVVGIGSGPQQASGGCKTAAAVVVGPFRRLEQPGRFIAGQGPACTADRRKGSKIIIRAKREPDKVLALPGLQENGKGTTCAFGDDFGQSVLGHHDAPSDPERVARLNLRVSALSFCRK